MTIDGKPKGHVEFVGLTLLTGARIETQIDQGGKFFVNVAWEQAYLDLSPEDGRLAWAWITARRDVRLSAEDTLRLAPRAWRRWVNQGAQVLEAVRFRLSQGDEVSRSAQIPPEGTAERTVLEGIYSRYERRRHHFEGLAAAVTTSMLQRCAPSYAPGWVLPASGDGGVDYVGRLTLGDMIFRLRLPVYGQAKCEEIGKATGLNAFYRMGGRLQRGRIGVFVTTGYFSEALQRELHSDHIPVLLVPGADLARQVIRLGHEHGTDVERFLDKVDAGYADSVQNREPDEVIRGEAGFRLDDGWVGELLSRIAG